MRSVPVPDLRCLSLISVLLLLLIGAARAQLAVELELAGVEAGVFSERQAVAKLGPGYRIRQPGGSTMRIYADAARTASLYVSSSPDGVVEQIQLVAGRSRPYHVDMRCRLPVSAWTTHARIGIGSKKSRVLMTYGEPHQEVHTAGLHWLSYKTDFGHDRRVRLYYQASFGLKNERVERIIIHNGN